MEMEPLQRPHPPIWYGVHAAESAARAAARGFNIASLGTAEKTRGFADASRKGWAEGKPRGAPSPRIGMARFIVVAETDADALATARRAYPRWHASFEHLFRRHGTRPNHPRPPEFDAMAERRLAVAGAADAVTQFLADQVRTSTADYLIGQFAFGDQSLEECLRTVWLFTAHVMPTLRELETAGGTL